MINYPQLNILKHPLAAHKLSLIRNKDTSCEQFRRLVFELSLLLFAEASQNLQLQTLEVTSPMETCSCEMLADKHPLLIPILRAGLGMVDAFLTLIPTAKLGHIGLMRNEETLQPETYYFKVPDDSHLHPAFICDPMLATGGTTVKAISELKQRNVKNITLVSILAAPEGIEHILNFHPDIQIYTASLERQLNSKGYILPGLGDAGDRLYGTH